MSCKYTKFSQKYFIIVDTIGTIDDLIEKIQEIINRLHSITTLIYSQKNNTNSYIKLKDCCIIQTGKLNAEASTIDGQYPFFTCGKDTLKIDVFAFDCNAIIISGNGDISVKYYSGKFNAYQRVYVLEPKKYFYLFLKELELSIDKLKSNSQGSVIKFITKGMLENIEINIDLNSNLLNQTLSNFFKLILEYKNKIENLSKIKKLLLEKYF